MNHGNFFYNYLLTDYKKLRQVRNMKNENILL